MRSETPMIIFLLHNINGSSEIMPITQHLGHQREKENEQKR